jgi:hypothetical protein
MRKVSATKYNPVLSRLETTIERLQNLLQEASGNGVKDTFHNDCGIVYQASNLNQEGAGDGDENIVHKLEDRLEQRVDDAEHGVKLGLYEEQDI